MVKVKEKYFGTNYRLAGILLNATVMVIKVK
jgi:hypothetical protein